MNITTHGKDGPRIQFIEKEKRRFVKTLCDLEFLSGVKGEVGQAASDAYYSLEQFIVTANLAELEAADQHREENSEEQPQ